MKERNFIKVVYFVDTEDNNHKDELCAFDENKYMDKEELAKAINQQIEEALFLDYLKDDELETFNEIGRSLAYNGYAQCKEYVFGINMIEII